MISRTSPFSMWTSSSRLRIVMLAVAAPPCLQPSRSTVRLRRDQTRPDLLMPALHPSAAFPLRAGGAPVRVRSSLACASNGPQSPSRCLPGRHVGPRGQPCRSASATACRLTVQRTAISVTFQPVSSMLSRISSQMWRVEHGTYGSLSLLRIGHTPFRSVVVNQVKPNRNTTRQLPETFTLHSPARGPFKECSRKPGASGAGTRLPQPCAGSGNRGGISFVERDCNVALQTATDGAGVGVSGRDPTLSPRS